MWADAEIKNGISKHVKSSYKYTHPKIKWLMTSYNTKFASPGLVLPHRKKKSSVCVGPRVQTGLTRKAQGKSLRGWRGTHPRLHITPWVSEESTEKLAFTHLQQPFQEHTWGRRKWGFGDSLLVNARACWKLILIDDHPLRTVACGE